MPARGRGRARRAQPPSRSLNVVKRRGNDDDSDSDFDANAGGRASQVIVPATPPPSQQQPPQPVLAPPISAPAPPPVVRAVDAALSPAGAFRPVIYQAAINAGFAREHGDEIEMMNGAFYVLHEKVREINAVFALAFDAFQPALAARYRQQLEADEAQHHARVHAVVQSTLFDSQQLALAPPAPPIVNQQLALAPPAPPIDNQQLALAPPPARDVAVAELALDMPLPATPPPPPQQPSVAEIEQVSSTSSEVRRARHPPAPVRNVVPQPQPPPPNPPPYTEKEREGVLAYMARYHDDDEAYPIAEAFFGPFVWPADVGAFPWPDARSLRVYAVCVNLLHTMLLYACPSLCGTAFDLDVLHKLVAELPGAHRVHFVPSPIALRRLSERNAFVYAFAQADWERMLTKAALAVIGDWRDRFARRIREKSSAKQRNRQTFLNGPGTHYERLRALPIEPELSYLREYHAGDADARLEICPAGWIVHRERATDSQERALARRPRNLRFVRIMQGDVTTHLPKDYYPARGAPSKEPFIATRQVELADDDDFGNRDQPVRHARATKRTRRPE